MHEAFLSFLRKSPKKVNDICEKLPLTQFSFKKYFPLNI